MKDKLHLLRIMAEHDRPQTAHLCSCLPDLCGLLPGELRAQSSGPVDRTLGLCLEGPRTWLAYRAENSQQRLLACKEGSFSLSPAIPEGQLLLRWPGAGTSLNV